MSRLARYDPEHHGGGYGIPADAPYEATGTVSSPLTARDATSSAAGPDTPSRELSLAECGNCGRPCIGEFCKHCRDLERDWL